MCAILTSRVGKMCVGSRLRPGSGRVYYARFHGPGQPGGARPCRARTGPGPLCTQPKSATFTVVFMSLQQPIGVIVCLQVLSVVFMTMVFMSLQQLTVVFSYLQLTIENLDLSEKLQASLESQKQMAKEVSCACIFVVLFCFPCQ